MRAMKKPNEITQVMLPLKITLVTDSHAPRKNGLSTTVSRMLVALSERELDIHLIRPRRDRHETSDDTRHYNETLVAGITVPGYVGMKAGLPAKAKLKRLWQEQRPDMIHISTEGPLGWSALTAAKELNIPVSTDIHSHFHRFSRHRTAGFMQQSVAAYLRHFHNSAACTLVNQDNLQTVLSQAGYQNVRVVTGSLDEEMFHPSRRRLATR